MLPAQLDHPDLPGPPDNLVNPAVPDNLEILALLDLLHLKLRLMSPAQSAQMDNQGPRDLLDLPETLDLMANRVLPPNLAEPAFLDLLDRPAMLVLPATMDNPEVLDNPVLLELADRLYRDLKAHLDSLVPLANRVLLVTEADAERPDLLDHRAHVEPLALPGTLATPDSLAIPANKVPMPPIVPAHLVLDPGHMLPLVEPLLLRRVGIVVLPWLGLQWLGLVLLLREGLQ